MAGADKDSKVFSDSDPFDINELASLNEDISPEFIEQLQSQVSQDAKVLNGDNAGEDAALFEEVGSQTDATNLGRKKESINIDNNIDDNFIKKYKARLNKQNNIQEVTEEPKVEHVVQQQAEVELPNIQLPQEEQSNMEHSVEQNIVAEPVQEQKIEKVSGGNIIERPFSQEQVAYSEELETIDGNTNYSKYVIYISPENKEFIDGLTVKERKNLINKIIREQGDISINRNKYCAVQTAIRHILVAIITIAVAIPVTYSIINASLEASIDNYRRSQGMFQSLYKEHGRIKNID